MADGQSLYVISDGAGNVKVGVGMSPSRRLRQFQTGNARRLSLQRTIPFDGEKPEHVERYAHWLLREHHVGGEWFSVSEDEAAEALVSAGIAVSDGHRAPGPSLAGRGRPRLGVKQFTYWLDPNDVAKAQALVGNQKMSEWVRAAIAEKLERDAVLPSPDFPSSRAVS